MYKYFKKPGLTIAGVLFFFMISAQSSYNVIKWGGTLTVNPATFTAGSLAGITDGTYSDNNRMNITGVAATDRWAKFQTNCPVVLSSYSLATNTSYRPTGWTFSGSNDGTVWVDLDIQTAPTFTSSVAKNFVLTNNTTAYTYYRIIFTTTYIATSLSINELELFTTSSVACAPVLSGSAISGTEAGFSWNYTLLATDSFFLERSLNGTDFTLVNKMAGTVASYPDQTLAPSTLYYYRIRSKNAYGFSSWSNVLNVTTNNLSGQSADITDDGGRLYASADNTGGATAGEGSLSLIDNNIASKWLVFTGQASGNLAAIYKPTGSYIVTSYVFGTANDSPPRDPKSWSFSGSNDSLTWIRLDTQVNQLGSNAARLSYYRYILSVPGSTAYKFYRMLMTSNNGATDGVRFQVAELQILGIDASSPEIPASLSVTNITTSSIALSWSQGTTYPVSKFRLQRGEDGINFSTIATIPGNATTYTDQNLYDSTVYYYRLQAIGTSPTAISGWSNVAKAETKFVAGLPLSPRDLKIFLAIDSVVGLKWTDRSYNETGFRMQRSVNGTTFTEIKSLDANTITFNDSTVWPATKYYYRLVSFNAQGVSVYSNIDSVQTTGYNHIPESSLPILNRTICSNTAEYAFEVAGLTPGPHNEWGQTLTITKVSADSAHFFSNISFTPVVSDGVAMLKLKGSGLAAFGDSVTVTIEIRDNGGVLNFGKDSNSYKFKIFYVSLVTSITADRDVTNVPRYVTVHLTGHTNYPSTTPDYSWDDMPGIEGSRNGIVLRVKPVIPVTYTIHATSVYGCEASAQITLVPDMEKYISNVLTPNGDGKNDKWIIWNITENPANSVKVFDRAGRLVFSKTNYSNDWDGSCNGKILSEGAYTYVVDFGNGQKPLTGMLNIIHDHK